MKVLVAGIGSIGQRHIRNLRTLLGDDVEILAYRQRGLSHVLTPGMGIDAGRDVQETYRLCVHTNLDEALAEKPAAVLVCNPTSLHMPVALAAAKAGCHLLVEKPLSDRLDLVQDLVREVEARGLIATVGYQMRFHPGVLLLRDLLARRVVGRIVSVRLEAGEYLPCAHPYEDYRQSYAARSDLGGGVILSFIHELDLAYWLFGMPRRVFAIGGHLSDLEIDVEDTAAISIECQHEGRIVPVSVLQDFVQRPARRVYEVVGSEGRIVFDVNAPRLIVTDATGQVVEHHEFDGFERNDLFLSEMRHFMACLRGQGRPAVTIHDGLCGLRMALAARESLATGRVVGLS